MGDGVQRKFAIFINGDTERRHLGNIDRAVEALRQEQGYEIFLASRKKPSHPVDHFVQPDEQNIKKLISGLRSKMDDDDLLLVYTTGHGKAGGKTEGCLVLPQTCYSLESFSSDLESLRFGRRIVVMDQCFSGGGMPFFIDDRTTVVTQGGESELVSCQEFSPHFWSPKVTDINRDGLISIQERYTYALKTGKSPALSQYFNPKTEVSLSGRKQRKPSFPPAVIEVTNQRGLQGQLKRLQPGQLALVFFSADWCAPCDEYEGDFETLAKKLNGQFLMIHAQGVDGSESDWYEHFGVGGFPTVAFINHRGKVSWVQDIHHPLDSVAMAGVYSLEDRIRIYAQKLETPDPEARKRAVQGLYDTFPLHRFLNYSEEIPEFHSMVVKRIGASPPRIQAILEYFLDRDLPTLHRAKAGTLLEIISQSFTILKKVISDKQEILKGEEKDLQENPNNAITARERESSIREMKREIATLEKDLSKNLALFSRLVTPSLTKLVQDPSESAMARYDAARILNRLARVEGKAPPVSPSRMGRLSHASYLELNKIVPKLIGEDKNGWRLSMNFFLNHYDGVATGFQLGAGYRRDRWELRVNLQGSQLPGLREDLNLNDRENDFFWGLSVEPLFHFIKEPNTWDPYLNLPEVGGYHLFGTKGTSALSLTALGAGVQVHLGRRWSLYGGAKMKGLFPLKGRPRLGMEVPVGGMVRW